MFGTSWILRILPAYGKPQELVNARIFKQKDCLKEKDLKDNFSRNLREHDKIEIV